MGPDLRYALRSIVSRRWFSLAIIATIGSGIGVNTMVFTLTNAVFIKPLEVHGGDRLVRIHMQSTKTRFAGTGFSDLEFREYRSKLVSFEALEALYWDRVAITDNDNAPQSVWINRISTSMFDSFGVSPVVGRGFSASDGQTGAASVALIGYSLWQDRFGGAASVVGRTVRIKDVPTTIIGVMPRKFKFPDETDVWMPLVPAADRATESIPRLSFFGILKPNVSMNQARMEMRILREQIDRELASPFARKEFAPDIQSFPRRDDPGLIQLFFLMQMAVVFVLLIACANAANMMFARGLERRQELAIRCALGASRWQIVRQLLFESALLAFSGGGVGFAMGAWGVRIFDLATEAVRPYWMVFSVDYMVFVYFAVLCAGAALGFGLAPALRASRIDLNTVLKDGARNAGRRRGGFFSGGLIVVQYALTLVLLTGAGMFVRGFLNLQMINTAIPADHLLGSRVQLPASRYPNLQARRAFFDQILVRLRAIPGVTSATLSSAMPGLARGGYEVEIEGRPPATGHDTPRVSEVVVSPGFFETINLPLLAGRDFNTEDGVGSRRSAIVTREFAERYWPVSAAVGKRFRQAGGSPDNSDAAWLTIVGVTAKLVERVDVTDPNAHPPTVFVPYLQSGADTMLLLTRSAGEISLAAPVRVIVHGIDPDLPVFQVETLAAAVDRQQWSLKLFSKMFGAFAVIALVISAVGLYAVTAHSTARRTQEIGVRMALGAQQHQILLMVLWTALWQMICGFIAGLAASIPGVKLMDGLHVPLDDKSIFVYVSLILIAVGVVASWLPARRAAALDPLVALRDE